METNDSGSRLPTRGARVFPRTHGTRIRDADGALDALAEGLELNGIRVPSLGIDLASLAADSNRPALITPGAVTPDTERGLGQGPAGGARRKGTAARVVRGGRDSRMTLRIGRVRLVAGQSRAEIRWLGSPCVVRVANDVPRDVRPMAYPPCECAKCRVTG